MDVTMVKTQAVKFNRARNNLLAVVAFTVINLLALTFDINFMFLFSAFVPQILLIILEYALGGHIGLIVALACTTVYVLCYAMSKRWRAFILVALILFALDTIVMLGAMFLSGAFADFMFNVAFHAWILFYLITGTVAWAKLRRVTPEELKALQAEATQEAQTKELNSALDAITSESDEEQ